MAAGRESPPLPRPKYADLCFEQNQGGRKSRSRFGKDPGYRPLRNTAMVNTGLPAKVVPPLPPQKPLLFRLCSQNANHHSSFRTPWTPLGQDPGTCQISLEQTPIQKIKQNGETRKQGPNKGARKICRY
ncbi:uncharacterized protein LOC120886156 [Ictidomys tridecemlineatus]